MWDRETQIAHVESTPSSVRIRLQYVDMICCCINVLRICLINVFSHGCMYFFISVQHKFFRFLSFFLFSLIATKTSERGVLWGCSDERAPAAGVTDCTGNGRIFSYYTSDIPLIFCLGGVFFSSTGMEGLLPCSGWYRVSCGRPWQRALCGGEGWAGCKYCLCWHNDRVALACHNSGCVFCFHVVVFSCLIQLQKESRKRKKKLTHSNQGCLNLDHTNLQWNIGISFLGNGKGWPAISLGGGGGGGGGLPLALVACSV